jgi:hypothetical protein
VNNPLRIPEISAKFRKAQRDPEAWDHLCGILNELESRQDDELTLVVFKQVLTEVYRRLYSVRVVYPTPRRVSLEKTMELMSVFSSEHSGGDRLLALTSALFVVIGSKFGLYTEVRRAKITAADKASGMLADLECISKKGEVLMAVEVKDRQIKVSQLRAKIRTIREKQVSEIFFIAQGPIASERRELDELIVHEFTSGYNIYLTDLISLGRAALALVGESGRQPFLAETANQLEKYHSEIIHRRRWAALLSSV